MKLTNCKFNHIKNTLRFHFTNEDLTNEYLAFHLQMVKDQKFKIAELVKHKQEIQSNQKVLYIKNLHLSILNVLKYLMWCSAAHRIIMMNSDSSPSQSVILILFC